MSSPPTNPSPPGSPSTPTPLAPNCITCGYSLAGLTGDGAGAPPTNPDGKCPECGTLIARSLLGGRLCFASEAYLRSLKLGLTLVLAGIVVSVVQVFIALFGPPLLRILAGVAPTAASRLVDPLLGFVISGLFVAGYWLYTTPDPGYASFESDRSARAVARVAAVVQACGTLGAFLVPLVSSLIPPASGSGVRMLTHPIVGLSAVVGLVAWCVLVFAVTVYTGNLARRVPDRALVATADRNLWALPLLATLGMVLCGLGPVVAVLLFAGMLMSMHVHVSDILRWRARMNPPLSPEAPPSPPGSTNNTIPLSTTGNPPET